ncbi:hypothetical protein QQP08_006588 [Theobroma cacao]|nr:hypothetical protein QQP08_006588 [Theobroma cacao]
MASKEMLHSKQKFDPQKSVSCSSTSISCTWSKPSCSAPVTCSSTYISCPTLESSSEAELLAS